MLFAKHLGYRPSSRTFVAGPEWKQFTMPFASFGAIDGSDLLGIAWIAGPKTGTFSFELDSIRLE